MTTKIQTTVGLAVMQAFRTATKKATVGALATVTRNKALAMLMKMANQKTKMALALLMKMMNRVTVCSRYSP